MATNYKYPIANGEELKKIISWVDKSIDIANVDSGFLLATDDLEDIISSEMYKVMIDHYNSDDYTKDDWAVASHGDKNQLVDLSAAFIAHLGMYHHFIWLQLRVGNNAVTTHKGKDETTAFKYQTDEAKDSLLKTAWLYAGKLLDFLGKKATLWTDWETTTDYKQDERVKHDNIYYEANADFTSTELFVIANWTVVDPADIIFPEWISSEQSIELKQLIFSSHKDFDKYFGIDKNAAFYVKARYIIIETIEDSLQSRIPDPSAITDAKLLIKVKRFLSYQTIALAVVRLDEHCLPQSMRKRIQENEKYSGRNDTGIKKVAVEYFKEASDRLRDIDNYLSEIKENVDETYSPAIQHEVLTTDKHISLI